MSNYTEKLNNCLLFRQGPESLPYRLSAFLDGGSASALSDLLSRAAEKGWEGNLWHCCLAEALLLSENPYTLTFERKAPEDSSLLRLAEKDMELWKELFSAESNHPAWEEITHFQNAKGGSKDAVTELAKELAASSGLLAALNRFLETRGCGIYALSHRFRIETGESGFRILPLTGGRAFGLSELVGYEAQKKLLSENTESFLRGKGANNVLLYGDAGTGKSTSIQALATEYGEKGLRIVEVHKDQFPAIPTLLETLRSRNYRFILLLDDLSFEENETGYKYLKSVMEGGAQASPENIRIYATSNRRHLVRENWSDRSDMEHDGDIHRSDTVEEKLSLAGRFGLKIYYPAPDFDAYLHIVEELAERKGVKLDSAELKKQAATWEVRNGSSSGRTAKQFIDTL